jgi:hypothetical protein
MNKRFYSIWLNIKSRCNNPNNAYYYNYGGRGIKICDRWNDFKNFQKDMLFSYYAHAEKHTEKNTTIDRIDNNKGYSPNNCRFVTRQIQSKNRKTSIIIEYKGEKYILKDLAQQLGFNRFTLYKRLKAGWDLNDVLSIKPIKGNNHLLLRKHKQYA